jgi:hypothetical protein
MMDPVLERSSHGLIEVLIWLEGPRKVTYNISQDSRYPAQHWIQALPRCESTVSLFRFEAFPAAVV